MTVVSTISESMHAPYILAVPISLLVSLVSDKLSLTGDCLMQQWHSITNSGHLSM